MVWCRLLSDPKSKNQFTLLGKSLYSNRAKKNVKKTLIIALFRLVYKHTSQQRCMVNLRDRWEIYACGLPDSQMNE